jgi:hypothetical protein
VLICNHLRKLLAEIFAVNLELICYIFNTINTIVDGFCVAVYRFIIRTGLIILILTYLGLATGASAMDRWAALSMIESGDNDHAIGLGGEISRFQIQRKLWPGGDPQNLQVALAVAQQIMNPRLTEFQKSHKRAPTDFEFYVLWNAPWEVDHPSVVVTERARRFANLVELVRR